MKSNHLLLLALKKVREHVGEGTNTSRILCFYPSHFMSLTFS